ncbi:MAG: MATE family efflux transporter [Oscillospiraceae bacterium]|jgi:putative MATE family efflux protein|nr:MATE family efflux transporter [Oscillospiraceae bacterium]
MNKIKSLFGAQDMTVGSPFLGLLKFSIPLLIGSIAQMLYTTADRIIVSKFCGNDAMSALGATMPIQNLFLVFFIAIGSGVTVMVSQYFGAKDNDNIGLCVGNSITLITITSIVVTLASTPFTRQILTLLNTNEQFADMAYIYLFILFLGSAANGFYNVIGGIIRGLGDSVFPLLILMLTVVLNVVLDIWFVWWFSKIWGPVGGVAGAALATIIAQYISAGILVWKLLTMKKEIRLTKQTLIPRKNTVLQITRLGLPTGIQMAVMFLSNIVMQPSIMAIDIATPAVPVFATMTATMSIDGYAVLPSQSFSMAASTFTGQNIGAGKMDRVKKGAVTCFLMCFIFTAIMAVLIQYFGRDMFKLFTKADDPTTPAIIELGMSFLRIMIPAYVLMTINMTFTGVMRGAGDSIGTMVISLIVNVVLKVPLTLIMLKITGDPIWIFLSMPICFVVGCAVTMIYYKKADWRKHAVVTGEVKLEAPVIG